MKNAASNANRIRLVIPLVAAVVLIGVMTRWFLEPSVGNEPAETTQHQAVSSPLGKEDEAIDHLVVLEPVAAREVRSRYLGLRASPPQGASGLRPAVASMADPALDLEERIPDEPLVAFETLSPLETEAIAAVAIDPEQELVVRHEAMAVLVADDPAGAAVILAAILSSSEQAAGARSYAVQHLGMAAEESSEFPWADDLLSHAFVTDPELEVRREAFLALARMGSETVSMLLDDPLDPRLEEMGDLVLAWWGERNLTRHAEAIPSLLAVEDERILLGAVALAGAWRLADARPALEQLADHPNSKIRTAASMALEAVSKSKL